MPKEIRDPKIIQEELSDLRAILQEEATLIAKYPEHGELLLAHSDTKKREQELISELEAAWKTPAIIYKFEEDSATLSNAPAQLIGNILVSMQGLIYSLAGASSGRRSKKDQTLYLLNVNFKHGSIKMEFSPASLDLTLDDSMRQTPIFSKASEFLSILPRRNIEYSELKLEVEKQIDDPRARITTLNALKRLLPPPGKKAEVTFRNINGDNPKTELHDDILKRRVEMLLSEELKKNDVEVFGVISRIKDDAPSPSFYVKDWSGKLVKVQMPDEKRDDIIDYLAHRVPIRLTGAGNKKRSLEIYELDEIEPNTRIIINSIRGKEFKHPIEAQLSYEKHDEESDYWVVGSDEFGAYGVDLTVEKAKEMFKDDLYSEYVAYKDLSNDKLTDKAVNLKRKLISLFEGE